MTEDFNSQQVFNITISNINITAGIRAGISQILDVCMLGMPFLWPPLYQWEKMEMLGTFMIPDQSDIVRMIITKAVLLDDHGSIFCH